MTSKSKDQTGNIQPSSSEESTAVQAQLSLPLVSSDNTPTSTAIMSKPSQGTLNGANTADNSQTTVQTTVQITEKTRLNAVMAKTSLRLLEAAGLIKRLRVLSPDGQHPIKMRIEFDLTLWSEDLELL